MVAWMKLDVIVLSKISCKVNDNCYMVTLLCEIKAKKKKPGNKQKAEKYSNY